MFTATSHCNGRATKWQIGKSDGFANETGLFYSDTLNALTLARGFAATKFRGKPRLVVGLASRNQTVRKPPPCRPADVETARMKTMNLPLNFSLGRPWTRLIAALVIGYAWHLAFDAHTDQAQRAVLPNAVVDLRTAEGVARLKAQWRYSDTHSPLGGG